jgi:hypothetical protein
MDSGQRLRRFIARPGGRHPTSRGLANRFKDSIAMFITDLAGATHIMRRRSLFVLWQVRRLINRWVAAAIAHRVYQLRSTRPRAGRSGATFAVSMRQANTARADRMERL